MVSLFATALHVLLVVFAFWLAPTSKHFDPALVAPTAVDVLPNSDEVNRHLPDSGAKPQVAVWLSETDSQILFAAARLDKFRSLHCTMGGDDDILMRPVGEKSQLVFAAASRHEAWNSATTSVFVTYRSAGKRQFVGPPNSAGKPGAIVWRGKDAPAAPAAVAKLQGTVRDYDVPSTALGETRLVTVYTPLNYEPGKADRKPAVIYFVDGTIVETIAGTVEAMIVARQIQPVVLVGAHYSDSIVLPKDLPADASTTQPDPYAGDARAMEYLAPDPIEAQSDARAAAIHQFMFDRHFKFFADDLPKWAEDTLGVDSKRESRFISGFSNSAGFIVTLARRRPMEYAGVIANSVAGAGPPDNADAFDGLAHDAQPPVFYFSDGTWERYFASNTVAWDRYFGKHGAESHRLKVVGGHDQAIWELGLVEALPKLLPPDNK